ncbi:MULTISPECIES: hypothetical protein [Klebsiella]|jgi:hypothetical protein|uniref:hypothetical protein n=1 Tax=Klebsiella TaxID=570 RepID=UPI00063C0046|nr:hypothetical protein [Klebsiella aerogenes]EIW9475955.1 hypothetical protein [Klebsiella aerogenes]EIW9496158.1 hypothetical protein [Klebsiella aerogenes]EKM7510726.1 hypothetical protein [Klebsiella aerogenes]ELW9550239.1 hypothetical protein [Klebsiella aerogenes]KLF11697.1 hypothetical protein YA28_21135 [Klebsiella aerogenes]
MTPGWIINAVLTLVIIFISFYLANRIVKNSQRREQRIIENGNDIQVTILAMRQTGLFINNNPVIDMDLRVQDLNNGKTWLVEKHQETVLLITLDAWQVGVNYEAKLDPKDNAIVFVIDINDKPKLTSER